MKKRSVALLAVLAVLLNSCVYSLFPIYTEDTLVFKSELLGKWSLGDKGSYLLFELDGDLEDDKDKDYAYSIEIEEGLTISANEPIFVMENGEKIYDEEKIREIMLERMAESEDSDSVADQVGDNSTSKKGTNPRDTEYSGSVSLYEKKSYVLTIVDDEGKKEKYRAHLVDIGGDLFMDLYPLEMDFNSNDISDNYFPVHTFFKVKVSEDKFRMIHFDLDKLNKLFDSNRIRLRHENVDGTILITAQPKDLQKFIDKYSEDESVFHEEEIYHRVDI